MKGTFFQRPVEYNLWIDGESWRQGDTVSGELTVRNHRCRIMAKLGLRTSAELVTYAYAKGFVRAQPDRAANG